MDISTKKLPTYQDTLNLKGRFKDEVDPSFIFKMTDEERSQYLDKWFMVDDTLWTFKLVDHVTASYLCEQTINPFRIRERQKRIFATIRSLDGSCFGVSIDPPTDVMSDHIKQEICQYLDRTEEFNGFDFLNFCSRFEKYNLQTFNE